jgi:threonine aldolase
MSLVSFGSDNHSGVHPSLLKAIHDANIGDAPSYGTDEWTLAAEKKISKIFGKPIDCFFVFNGTGANVTALKALTQTWQSVLVSDVSHLNVDECAAPEALAGCKLIPVPSQNGKLSVDALDSFLIRRGDQHFSQAQAISITQPTELGTCYSIEELKTIGSWAKKNKLFLHIDGARFANAAVSLSTSLKNIIEAAQADVLSMGGTKNGFMMGEAVIFFNPALSQNFKYIRKQFLQLPSKSRFIAAQFLAYFENDLYLEIAKHSLSAAEKLYQLSKDIPAVKICYPRQSNAVFAQIPQSWIKPLREKFFFYVWDEKTFTCRWMTSWNTTDENISAFARELKNIQSNTKDF